MTSGNIGRCNIKKVSRLVPNSYEFSGLVEQLGLKDDFEIVVTGGAYLDRMIEICVMAKLKEVNKNFDIASFIKHGLINDFEKKIQMAHYLGLISDAVCKQFKIIKSIRNAFSHTVISIGFEHEAIKSHVLNLKPSEICNPESTTNEMRSIFHDVRNIDYVSVKDKNGLKLFGKEHYLIVDSEDRLCAYIQQRKDSDLTTLKDRFVYAIQMSWYLMLTKAIIMDPVLVTSEIQM